MRRESSRRPERPAPSRAPAVNVAATSVGAGVLGPGRRSIVWVQGCPLSCEGCIAPAWIPQRPARLVAPKALVEELLADPKVEGLTFSGGEPMAQAQALAEVARMARRARDLSLICFTGYRLERLRSRPPTVGVADLLGQVDVLIDGPYVQSRDDGRGLRGSDNQRIHHLTDRLAGVGYDFEARPRTAEIRVRGREAMLIGIPPHGLLATFEAAVHHARSRMPPVPARGSSVPSKRERPGS